jgi:drug/metabolite transporter (DMT)-like permease
LRNNILGHTFVITANILYGINYVIAKGIMPDHLSPRAIIFIRVAGALAFFWLFHSIFIKEKVARKDLLKLAFCAIFGVAINQIMFFEGLNKTTEINTSIIMTINPIMVLIFSYFLLKEKITIFKIFGIMLGGAGAVYLILSQGNLSLSSDTFVGNLFIIVNASSFALYLVLVKPLMSKYNPLTIMKWIFLFGFIYVFPFSIGEVVQYDLTVIPTDIWLLIAYVIVGTTILGYLLYNFALQKISATTTSFYIYLQPLLASMTVILLGRDNLTHVEIISAILIFAGVFMVSRKSTNSL